MTCEQCGKEIKAVGATYTDEAGEEWDYEGEAGHAEDCPLVEKYA